MSFLSSMRRWSRALGRRLTPPGNRAPIEESLEQRPGLSSHQQPIQDAALHDGPMQGMGAGDRATNN